jgi:hypothetical protein
MKDKILPENRIPRVTAATWYCLLFPLSILSTDCLTMVGSTTAVQ